MYWLSEKALLPYSNGTCLLGNVATPCAGLATGDNNIFQKHWYEVQYSHIGFGVNDVAETKSKLEKWYPCNSSGDFRKWYPDNLVVVNWQYDGIEIKTFKNAAGNLAARPQNTTRYFKEGLTWNKLSTSRFAVKYKESGFIFDDTSRSAFPYDTELLLYYIGSLCSCVTLFYLQALDPTMSFTNGDLIRVPMTVKKEAKDIVTKLVRECISISRIDWDAYEISWDFQRHPLLCYGVSVYSGLGDMQLGGEYSSSIHVKYGKTSTSEKTFEVGAPPNYRLETSFTMWKQACESRFQQLKANEEELNRIFIDIYGLQDELTPEVADKDITVHRIFNTKEDVPESMQSSNYVRTMRDEIVSLISYAVGCMFGRYSLYKPGLIYAGGDWDSVYGDFPIEKISLNENVAHGAGFHTYGAPIVDKAVVYLKEPTEMQDAEEFWGVDADNIIPISDDEYFEDDIVGRFVEFVRIVYGTETLDENLQFIADALGGKGTPKEVIRNYFLTKFYADHCKMYQKRPIYWLFDSGKKNGFKCLIYMHRYQPDTIARIRTDYVHEQQARYRTAIADLEQRIANAATGERVKLNKQLKKLNDQAAEILAYEEKIHHLADQMIPIDLDDGVKVNYAKFQDVLAKIK